MSLIESVDSLNSRVDTLRNDLDTNVSSIRDGSVFSGKNFSSSGINLFETCEMVIEGNCTIMAPTVPGARPVPCSTIPEVPLHMVSVYYYYCAIILKYFSL